MQCYLGEKVKEIFKGRQKKGRDFSQKTEEVINFTEEITWLVS